MVILHTNPSVSYPCPFQDHPEEAPELPDEPDVAPVDKLTKTNEDEQQSKQPVRTLSLLSTANKTGCHLNNTKNRVNRLVHGKAL